MNRVRRALSRWPFSKNDTVTLLVVGMLVFGLCFSSWISSQASGDAHDAKAAATDAQQASHEAQQAAADVKKALDVLEAFAHQQCVDRRAGTEIGNQRASVLREFLLSAETARRDSAAQETGAQQQIDLAAANQYAALRAQVKDSTPPTCKIASSAK